MGMTSKTPSQTTSTISETSSVPADLQGGLYLDPVIPKCIRIIVVVMVSVCIIVSNIINVLVLRKTHMSSNARICLINLGVADLIVGCVTCAPCIAVTVMGFWPYGEIWCQIAGFSHGVSAVVSIWSLAFVSLDRYVAIVKALHYCTLVTKSRCRIALVCLWMAAAASFIVPLFIVPDHKYYHFNAVEGICGLYWEFPLLCILTGIFPVSSGIVICCTTFGILRYLKAHGDNLRLTGSSVILARERRSRDQKAVKILTITTCLYFICWGPYVVSVIMTSFFPKIQAPPTAQFIFLWVANSNSFINVLVYSAIYKSFRDEIKRMVLCYGTACRAHERRNVRVSYVVSPQSSSASYC
ncbi:hypothetical protein SNE40_005512 [Patella caerulea]|uniref:G-protein coupled receptors family 1 profile domain-containing protein n=1 Tax=Patella caerulea TaxID=87958 RepID=A0AAN8K816_PATCE